MSGPVLGFAGVGFSYPGSGRPALEGVTLSLAQGEGVALLGANGAGKTTLMRLAMAFIQPSRGEVLVAGRATRRLAPEDVASVTGYLFQHPESQLFERTVRAELAFGPKQLGWTADRIAERVGAVLARLELADAADDHPYDLPLPRRRLVALGAALMAEPVLLLLDEPTAGLDRRSRDLVTSVVRAHTDAGGAAVAVTHDTRFALEALGRAIVLAQGRVVADAGTADVLSDSAGQLPMPAHAQIAERLALRPASLRLRDVAAALAAHCSGAR